MKFLILTQTVHLDDPVLGFFHEWIDRLARQADSVIVLCLKEGKHALPPNVRVVSLGKENMRSRAYRRVVYWWRFCGYIRRYVDEYDCVFIHMNPEYAILGGRYWRRHGKKVLLWYTHKTVNLRLRLAEKFVTKIFTASKESFRLLSRKVEAVGHGIPVDAFVGKTEDSPDGHTIGLLWVGRVTPSKDVETVLKAIAELQKKADMPRIRFTLVGRTATDADEEYKKSLEEAAHTLGVSCGFQNPRLYAEMPGIYHHHRIFIHTSRTGSMDKVVLEAMASGLWVATSSEAFADFGDLVYRFAPNDYRALARIIEKIVNSGILAQRNEKAVLYVREHHNLDVLIRKIIGYGTS